MQNQAKQTDSLDEWELPILLKHVQRELIRRNAALTGNQDPQIKQICHNNLQIMSHLQSCIDHAERSEILIKNYITRS